MQNNTYYNLKQKTKIKKQDKKKQRQYNVNNKNSLTSGYVGITISGSLK